MHSYDCIYENNEDLDSFFYECYSKTNYLKVYSHVINPINGLNLWEKVRNQPGIIIAPSPVRKRRGRRPIVRRKEAKELEKEHKRRHIRRSLSRR